jgi:hypothetical protein
MEAIIRNVRDLEEADRRALEHLVGQPLRENQRLVIRVETLGSEAPEGTQAAEAAQDDALPDWCNVYEGLTEQEIDELESVILQRANRTRPSE